MAYEVSVVKCDSYDESRVRAAVEESLKPLAGLGSVVKKGDKVDQAEPALFKKAGTGGDHPPCAGEGGRQNGAGAGWRARARRSGAATPPPYTQEETGIQQVADETGCPVVSFDEQTADVFSEKARTFKKLKDREGGAGR